VPGIFLGVKSSRHVGLTTLPPSVSRMSENVGASTSRNLKGFHSLYGENFTFCADGYIKTYRKDLNASTHDLIKVLTWHLPQKTKENNENSQLTQCSLVKFTNVLEEHTAFIFYPEDGGNRFL
jgi:hypothetical protein